MDFEKAEEAIATSDLPSGQTHLNRIAPSRLVTIQEGKPLSYDQLESADEGQNFGDLNPGPAAVPDTEDLTALQEVTLHHVLQLRAFIFVVHLILVIVQQAGWPLRYSVDDLVEDKNILMEEKVIQHFCSTRFVTLYLSDSLLPLFLN